MRRTRLKRTLAVCAAVVLAAGLALVWLRVVETLTEPSNGPDAIGRPGALVWDGRVFTSADQFSAYLTSKGRSYSRWAARHPTAFGARPPAVTGYTTTIAKTVTTPAKPVTHHTAAPPVLGDAKSKSLTSLVLTLVLLAAGLVLGGSAALPPRYAPVALRRFYAAPDRRMVALAAATAILLGFGVSFYLT